MRGEVDAIRVIDAPLPNNWESATFYSLLKEGSLDLVQDGNHGGSYPKAEEFESSGVPLITGADLNDGAINLKDCKFLKPTSAEKLRIGFAKQGDVLLTHKGTMGKTAIVPPLPCPYIILNPQITLYRVSRNGRLNNRFLKYFFDGAPFQAFLERISGISTISTLSLTVQKSIEIPVPPLPEQRAIAHILGTLDDKIELNRRRNQTLEAMARALFKDWFVDFGPVRAKMENQEPYLLADLWQRFADRLDDEGKPEGWEMQPLSELLTIIGGGTPKTSVEEYWGGNIPWFSVVDTPSASDVFVVATEKTITSQGLAGSSARLIPKGTTIISARGTVGNLAVAGREMTFNQSCYGLRGTGNAGDYFVYLTAQQMVDQLKSMAHGSVFSTITRQTFEAIQRPVRPPSVLAAFEELVTGWFDAILSNVEESRTLAQLRDTLLPKLISGELRIKDAERFMEEPVHD